MKLFANGCSFTWGGGLYPSLYDQHGILDYHNPTPTNKHRLERVWPAHLADLLGAEECVNLSMGCGSNDRIVRTTMDFFSQNTDTDWLVIIQLTQPHRFEYWDEQHQTWVMNIPNSVKLEKNITANDTCEHIRFRDSVYVHTNDRTYAQKYWTQVIGLASFLSNRNLNYKFINLVKNFDVHLEEYQRQYLSSNVNWLNDNYMDTIGSLFSGQDDGTHPTVEGHKEIAQSIFDKLK
jgi:hypothetical protein